MQIHNKSTDFNIEFEVTHSKRTTMAIKISPTGTVHVAVPNRTSKKDIIDWVNSKSGWIIKKLTEIDEIKADITSKEYIQGESFMYLGLDYPLQIEIHNELNKPTADLNCGRFIVRTSTADSKVIRSAMEAWYRYKADEIIQSRIEYYKPMLNVSPNRVTIREQKTRWGSCSFKGNLNFNWKAMRAPFEVLEYLVVHELCHLVHLNHSHEYWSLVSSILPDYKVRKDWLRKNGIRLSL